MEKLGLLPNEEDDNDSVFKNYSEKPLIKMQDLRPGYLDFTPRTKTKGEEVSTKGEAIRYIVQNSGATPENPHRVIILDDHPENLAQCYKTLSATENLTFTLIWVR